MAMDSPLGPFALSSAGLLQPGPEEPAPRGGGMGSFRDQLDRITGGIKRRSKHLRNLQRRLEQTHAQLAELNLAIAPLQKRILLETNSIATLRTQAISLESSLKDEEVYERSIRWVNSSFPGLASNLDADLLVSARTLYRKLSDAWSYSLSDSPPQSGTCSRPTLDTSIATPKDVSVGNQEPSIQIDQAPSVVTGMVERPINFKVAMRRLHVFRNHVNVSTSSSEERGAAHSKETTVGSKRRRPRPKKCHNQYGKIANALINDRLIQRDGGWEVPLDDSC